MDPQVSDSPFDSFLQNNKLTVVLILVGILLIGFGVLGFKMFQFSSTGPKVEILGTEDTLLRPSQPDFGGQGKITVEAAGEVMKPGVYELAVGSRVNDLLTVAGGMSGNADREWVSKSINLAQKLVDGAKIYVPSNNQILNPKSEIRNNGNEILNSKININTASESELDTLSGVGEVTAKKIIAGRPYQTTEELLNKKIVNKGVWEKIKDSVTVY